MQDDFFDEVNEGEEWKPFFTTHKKLQKKAKEIFHLLLALKESFSEEELEKDSPHAYHLMMENITKVMAKLAGAQAVHDMYHALMENAVLVKVNMRELQVQLFSAKEFYNGDATYLQVIRDETEIFKELFIEWRKTFDPSQDLPDDWHLFNDPDSFPKEDGDKDFNADNFFGEQED